jgi:uncharacterized phage protein (TIGR02216 family)
MRAGLRGLKLQPQQFWGLTPAELQLMLGAAGGEAPLLKKGLEALMDAYPDKTKDRSDG